MSQFDGKSVFISGGSKGIGLACAKRLGREGARIFLASSSEPNLKAAAEAVRAAGAPEVDHHAASLKTLEGCNEAASTFLDRFGGCDIFVHSAGATKGGIFPDQPDEEMVDGFALKFHAGVRLARALWPSLKARHGTVINIVGGFSRTPAADFMVGGAVNAALANFTKALAEQGLRDDVNVTWIHPGLTRTERLDMIFADRAAQQGKTEAQVEQEAIAAEGIRRLGKPEDLAELVAFLCTPAARHIHGTGIVMDGGGAKGYY